MTPTPPADPYAELRKAAEKERDNHALYGGHGNELSRHAATILALLAERDRLTAENRHYREWYGRDDIRAALRKSEERAAKAEAELAEKLGGY